MGVIATDPIAYDKPNGSQIYLDEIRKVTDKPVKHVIYSHQHYDHIAGGKRCALVVVAHHTGSGVQYYWRARLITG